LGHAALGALETGMGMERAGTIRAIVLTGTLLVPADRYSGVNPLSVLYLSRAAPLR
jgi:hypothetical protein